MSKSLAACIEHGISGSRAELNSPGIAIGKGVRRVAGDFQCAECDSAAKAHRMPNLARRAEKDGALAGRVGQRQQPVLTDGRRFPVGRIKIASVLVDLEMCSRRRAPKFGATGT